VFNVDETGLFWKFCLSGFINSLSSFLSSVLSTSISASQVSNLIAGPLCHPLTTEVEMLFYVAKNGNVKGQEEFKS
jgi:hypothetical protein